MPPSVTLTTVHGGEFVSIGNTHVVPKQSLVADWEGTQWGDGKFPGAVSVSAIATLRQFATIADAAAVKTALNSTADDLTRTLADQIESFQSALAAAART
jgi:hypothetical protein